MYGDFVVRVGADLSVFNTKMGELEASIKKIRELSQGLDVGLNTDNVTKFSQAIDTASTSMEKLSAAANNISTSVTAISDATTKITTSTEGINKMAKSMETVDTATKKAKDTMKELGDVGESSGKKMADATDKNIEKIQTLNQYVLSLIQDLGNQEGIDPQLLINEQKMAEFKGLGTSMQRGFKDALNIESLATMLSSILGNQGPLSRAIAVGLRSTYLEIQRQKDKMQKLATESTDAGHVTKLALEGKFGPDVQQKAEAYQQGLSERGVQTGRIEGRNGRLGRASLTGNRGAGAGGTESAEGVVDELEKDAITAFKNLQGQSKSVLNLLKSKGIYQQMEEAAKTQHQRNEEITKYARGAYAAGDFFKRIDGELSNNYTQKIKAHQPTSLLQDITSSIGKWFQRGTENGGGLGGGLSNVFQKSLNSLGNIVGKGATNLLSGIIGKGAGAAIGGALGSVVPIVGNLVGAMAGSLLLQGATSLFGGLIELPKMFSAALKGAIDEIVRFGAGLQEAEFGLEKAFGENAEWMNAQAEKISQGTVFGDEEIMRGMSKVGMAVGENLNDQQIASLTGTTAQMGMLMGGNIEGASQMLSMLLMSGGNNSRMARQIQMQTGIDLSAGAVQEQLGISKEQWKGMSQESQTQKYLEYLNNPETQKRLKDLGDKYLNTINGQMQLLQKNSKSVGDYFKDFGDYAVPVLKVMNGLWQSMNGMVEPFAKTLKGVVDGVGKSTGLSTVVGDVTKGVYDYSKMRQLREKSTTKDGLTKEEQEEYDTLTKDASDTTKTLWEILDKIYETWDKINPAVYQYVMYLGEGWKLIQPIGEWIANKILPAVEFVADQLTRWVDILKIYLATASAIMETVFDPNKGLAEKIEFIARLMVVGFSEMFKKVIEIFANGAKGTIDIGTGLNKALASIFVAGINKVLEFFVIGYNDMIDEAKTFVGYFLDIWIQIVNGWHKLVDGGWKGIYNILVGGLTNIWNLVSEFAGKVIDAFLGMGSSMISSVVGAVTGVYHAITKFIGSLPEKLRNLFGAVGSLDLSVNTQGLEDSAKIYKDNITAAGNAISQHTLYTVEDAEALKSSIMAALEGKKLTLEDWQIDASDVGNFIQGIGDAAKGGIDSIAAWLTSKVDTFENLFGGEEAKDKLKEWLDKWKTLLSDSTPDDPVIKEQAANELAEAMGGLKDTIDAKKMDSKIEIFITQTFEGPVDEAALALAGQTAEAAVIAALQKKGIVPS